MIEAFWKHLTFGGYFWRYGLPEYGEKGLARRLITRDITIKRTI
jgi:hypothetical protein